MVLSRTSKRRLRVVDGVAENMKKSLLVRMNGVSLVLLIGWACGNSIAQTRTASGMQPLHGARACSKDSQCPSGQRCGFTSGCNKKGKCVVPSHDTHCIDPGGRCGCDGRPVDIFCAVGSRTEFASAPANAVGPCPRPCTSNSECSSGLVCKQGFCSKP